MSREHTRPFSVGETMKQLYGGVDFDRSLITVNSFPYFVVETILQMHNLLNGKSIFLFTLVLMRKFKIIPHLTLQNYVHRYYTHKELDSRIVKFLRSKLDHDLIRYLKTKYPYTEIVVCTGANESFVRQILRQEDFVECIIGSSVIHNKLHVNLSENKLKALTAKNYTPLQFFVTDHFSDFCLAKITKNFYIIRPDNTTKQISKSLDFNIQELCFE